MTSQTISPSFAALKRNDPVLVRALQAVTFGGLVLGMLLYAFIAVRSDVAASHRHLADAASAGQLAAEAELARIDAAAERALPLVAGTLGADVSASALRAARNKVGEILASSPVSAIAVMDGRGGVISVFGQMPADAVGRLAPPAQSQRAGRELLQLDFASISSHRAAYFSAVELSSGARVPVVFILRAGAFRAALDAAPPAARGARAALLNVDGAIVLSSAPGKDGFSAADGSLATRAANGQRLYTEETLVSEEVAGAEQGTLLEFRPVAGGRLHLAYIGNEPSVQSAIAARQWEFLALAGATLLALVLALSLIQNEWRREDRDTEDLNLALAQARASSNLLDAGVIDWSVADGRVTYSDGWAERFARGLKPASEEAFDWIARIHPEDQASAREIYQLMLDGAAQDIEHRIRVRLPSGLWVQVLERGRMIGDAEGRPARIVLVQTLEAADGGALKQAISGLTDRRVQAAAG